MIAVYGLHPSVNARNIGDIVGFIPGWLDEEDPRSASVQLDTHYQHGGGWRPFKGHRLEDDYSIKYPGDPAHPPLAGMCLREELIFVYESGWVAIVQPDKSFEVCRMD